MAPATRRARIRTVLALFALTLASTMTRLWALGVGGRPAGSDGYYYAVQVADRVALGHWHIEDASWVLRWLAAVHATGLEPVLAVAVGASLLAASCVPLGFWLGRSLGNPAGGWLVAAWAAGSPTLTLLAGDFPKNLGIVPAGLGLAAALAHGGRARWTVPVWALATFTAHRTGAALLLLAALGAALAIGTRAAPRRLAGVLVAAACIVGLDLGGLLGRSDLARLEGAWTLGLPRGLFGYVGAHPFHPLHLLEWTGAVLAFGWLLWQARGPARTAALALALPLAALLLPPWRTDVLDVGYRLSLLAPVVAAAALALWRPRARPAWWLGLAPLLAPSGLVAVNAPPWERWSALLARLPERPPLLIAHRGLALLHDYEHGGEAMAWAPEPELDRSEVGRITWGIRDAWWLAWGQGPRTRIGPDYAYVREADWERFVARSRDDEEVAEVLADWRNPTEVRPHWLTR